MQKPTNRQLVFDLVNTIPKGKIVSYGDVGGVLNINPRIVGFILSGMNQSEMGQYAWHRVVDRNGFMSTSKLGDKGKLQQSLLEAEGIKIKDYQIINPKKYWFKFERGKLKMNINSN